MSTKHQTPTALDVPAGSAPMTDTEAIALYVVMDAIKTLRIARGTLCNVAQLIGGWKTTTPPAEWSEWDEQTYQSLIALMKRIEPNTKTTDAEATP